MLIAKLHAYGFSKISLNLISNYLYDTIQRTKVGDKFSTWRKVLYGVPQGSILGPLLFNIYINDLFLFSQNFSMANYADDCSPYEFSGPIGDVSLKLQNDSLCLLEWYESNYLKPNPDKWHLLLSDKGDNNFIKIVTDVISNSTDEKILGVYFDNKLNFNTHLIKLCKKASQKLHALARFSNLMSIRQRNIIVNAFIHSQFNYCPLVWMCHNRTINSLINNIHERALRIVYKDNISSFTQLLEKSGSVSIRHRNLQALAIEVYKALNNLSFPLMSDLIKLKEMTYNLRNTSALVSTNTKTTNYGINSISYLAPKIWDQVPTEIKNSKSLYIFKQKIKIWIHLKCPCTLQIACTQPRICAVKLDFKLIYNILHNHARTMYTHTHIYTHTNIHTYITYIYLHLFSLLYKYIFYSVYFYGIVVNFLLCQF